MRGGESWPTSLLDDLFCVLFITEAILLSRLAAFADLDTVRCCKSGGTPVRGGGQDLDGILLPEITHCKNARDIGLAFFVRDDISGNVGLDPGGNQLTVGDKTNENEDTFGSDIPLHAGLSVLQGNDTVSVTSLSREVTTAL